MNAKPGITIPELADPMGIQANYLYRVMPGLQKDGKVQEARQGLAPGLTSTSTRRQTQTSPSLSTASRSSTSSAFVASIFSLRKSLSSRPSTI